MGTIKRYFLILTLGFAVIGQAQIVDIPDPNFKSALLLQNSIDTNDDGEIQVSEALATTAITVNSASINDLTGIEAFANITFLDCSTNNLSSLDISTNTALEIIICSNNQLASLDTSANNALFQIECSFNQLATIDLSNNPNLVLLFIGNNPMSQVDVSNNPILFILECRETLIENLDLSTVVLLESLICNDNSSLETINLKNGNNANITFDGPFASDFQNLPSLQTICVDDLDNVALIDEITDQVGSPVNFTEDCVLGIEDLIVPSITFFPNPSKDFVTIESAVPYNSILVYNIQGRLLKTHTFTAIKQTLNISEFDAGMYFFKITWKNTSITKQIIKN